MKILSRLFTAAFILFAAASCHTNEIDNPDNPNQNGKSEITITASIIQTRVSYDCSDLREVKQKWEVGDIVFGFHSGSSDESNQITFRVSAVNSETGEASLVAVSGAGWIETDVESGRVVDLVYTGTNASYNTSGGIDVDLSQQTLGRVRGCMHAHAALQIDNEGNKTLKFIFQNDCALIEIDGLSGAVEDWEDISSGQQVTSVGISQISIPNLYLKGSYSYNNGSLSFATNSKVDECVITLDPTEWSINNQGFINGPNDFQGYPQKILIAVAPYLEELPFLVTATIPSLGEFPDIEYDYDYKQLEKGNCYVISPQPVVARTADGQYFTSVSGAFDHAKQLKDTYDSEETNIVTLVQDCGLAGVTKQDGSYVSNIGGKSPISIDNYNITFDLNGHTLTLDNYEYFNVSAGKTFIIKDSSDDKGIIQSNYTDDDGYHLIKNYGTVQIEGGQLRHNKDWSAVRNYQKSTLVVNGGVLYSGGYFAIDNRDASVTINKGNISADYAVINNTGELTINGGTISSESTYNIIENSDCLKIYGGTVYSSGTNSAIMSDGGTVYIYGGVISNSSSIAETILILNGAECTISGGVIYSEGDISTIACRSTSEDAKNSKLWITWPTGAVVPEYDPASGKTRHEPLIYSFGSAYQSSPITANYDHMDNTAEVYIQGGYLLAHNQNSYGYFYNDDNINQDKFDNLQFSSCGHFYANTYMINMKGDTNKDVDLRSYTYDNKTITGTDKSSECFTPEFLDDVFDDYQEETSLWYFE